MVHVPMAVGGIEAQGVVQLANHVERTVFQLDHIFHLACIRVVLFTSINQSSEELQV